jgi:hypothetical protein
VRGQVSRTLNATPSRPSGNRTSYGSDDLLSELRAMMNSITLRSPRRCVSTVGHGASLPDGGPRRDPPMYVRLHAEYARPN